MPTETSICNSALAKIGKKRILNLQENSPQAILCNEQFPKLRDAEMRAHPWNFAIKRLELAQLTESPPSGYTYQFGLPTSGGEGHCLRVLEIDSTSDFAIEGRALLTNDSTCIAKIIQRVTSLGLYDAMFAEALAWRLAIDLAKNLTGSAKTQENMIKGYDLFMIECRSTDGQEGTAQQVDDGPWLDARL